MIFRKLSTERPILIPEFIPLMRNPSITRIVTSFLASRKCDYYEWGQYLITRNIKGMIHVVKISTSDQKFFQSPAK